MTPGETALLTAPSALRPTGARRREPLATMLGIVGIAFLARAVSWQVSVIDWDEGVYLVMAQEWLRGGLPYVAVWDQHPPGLPALLAAGLAVLPHSVLSARLLASAAVAATALLLYFFARARGEPRGGLLAAVLYILCISRFAGLAANTELFNNALVAGAAWLLFGAARARHGGRLLALGGALLLGLGLQVKYVVVPEAVIFCLALLAAWRRQGRRGQPCMAGLLLLAGCLPTLWAACWFWWHGALVAFLAANIGSNLTYITILPRLVTVELYALSGLAPMLGPILLMVFVAGARRPRAGMHHALALWLAAASLDVVLPLKFYPHHFFALYPPLCLGAALAWCELSREGRWAMPVGLAALFSLALPLYLAGQLRSIRLAAHDTPRALAALLVAARAGDGKVGDGDVFVYDDQPVIYLLAALRPPTPYVMHVELTRFHASSGADGPAEITRIMDRRPLWVVAHPGPQGQEVHGALDLLLLRRLGAYELVATLDEGAAGAVRLYRRR